MSEEVVEFGITIDEYTHPVQKYYKEVRWEKQIAVFLDSEFLIVIVEGNEGVYSDINYHVKRKYALDLVSGFERFAKMIAELYFSGIQARRDIVYDGTEEEGADPPPAWERYLTSLGFGYD